MYGIGLTYVVIGVKNKACSQVFSTDLDSIPNNPYNAT